MISLWLLITVEHRQNTLKQLGMCSEDQIQDGMKEPIVWLKISKWPFDSEGLADKGFETHTSISLIVIELNAPGNWEIEMHNNATL